MQNTFRESELPIQGMRLLLNKVVGDERGIFTDLAEQDNPIFKDNLRHIHAAIAVHKGVARGCHYHNILTETFYVLAGTGICIFHDFRKSSPTYNTTYAAILGYEKPKIETSLPTHTMQEGSLAQVIVPPGIYHGFWPITDEKMVIVSMGTHGYDPDDYVRPTLDDIPNAKALLAEYGIEE